ncbi:MAG: RES domain-containing protein [Acidimicrobiales bacterium]
MDPRRLRLRLLAGGTPFFRIYPVRHGCDAFNPGRGDSRLAPLHAAHGSIVPTLYGGEDETVALLESAFHDVHHDAGDRVVYERMLRQLGLAHLRLPVPLPLVDLRDPQLARLGLHRKALVATTAAHYSCTREWARWLHGRRFQGQAPAGLLWHSRQADLAGRPAGEVFTLFGDRAPRHAGAYPLVGPGVRNLVEGPGRLLVEAIAESLDARIEPAAGDDASGSRRTLDQGTSPTGWWLGRAGTGKTFVLDASRAPWQASGHPVLGGPWPPGAGRAGGRRRDPRHHRFTPARPPVPPRGASGSGDRDRGGPTPSPEPCRQPCGG